MAETLPIEEMLPNKFEPKRRFRWLLAIEGLDAFLLKRAERPRFQKSGLSDDDSFKVRPMKFEIYDPIAPSGADQIWEWMYPKISDTTPKGMTAEDGKLRDATLNLLDPVGTIVESWTLKGLELQDVDFGALSYSEEDFGKKEEETLDWINSKRYLHGPSDSVMTISFECSVKEAVLLPWESQTEGS